LLRYNGNLQTPGFTWVKAVEFVAILRRKLACLFQGLVRAPCGIDIKTTETDVKVSTAAKQVKSPTGCGLKTNFFETQGAMKTRKILKSKN